MATKTVSCLGMKCPMPVLQLTKVVMKKEVGPGDQIELIGDCPTLEADVRQWCTQMKKVLVRFVTEGPVKRAFIQV